MEKIKEELSLVRKEKSNRGELKYVSHMKRILLDVSSKKEIHMARLTNYAITPKELEQYLERMAEMYS